ncbi:MAG: radical SAM protein [Candidatus Peribacteria bacterium]|jgi:hypothetical protein|nr:radical SAM protein [Candidatus Peribacteria bacterium]
MKVQSLSIAVPAGCTNRCEFCVSGLHNQDRASYGNQIEDNFQFKDLYERDYMDALSFSRDNGCNTMMFTGDGEALLNRTFMEMVSTLNKRLASPFRWIELQTSGVFLTQKAENGGEKYLRWLRDYIRVKTISLSLSSVWSSSENASYNRPRNNNAFVDIEETCKAIKKYDFSLRLSLNMTDFYDEKTPAEIFCRAEKLGADQVTFRVLYNIDHPQDDQEQAINDWILDHRCQDDKIEEINQYIREHGRPLERLPFGAVRYSVHGMSCVLDSDCMNSKEELKNEVKYLILRPNCKLYTKWDDKGSVLF